MNVYKIEHVRPRRICVFLATRGNYAKMHSVMISINNNPNLELQIVIGGSLVLDEYEQHVELIKNNGFFINDSIHYILKGDTPESIASSSGFCTAFIAQAYNRLNPDISFIIADRFESLAAAQAALCLNIHIAHLEGGEISGSIDERIRHAITKLSHIHLVCNCEAKDRVIKLGENPENVFNVGNPSLDQLIHIDLNDTDSVYPYLKEHGKGTVPNLKKSFLVVSQHPVVTDVTNTQEHIHATIEAIKVTGKQAIWVLPNIDAGSEIIRDKVNACINDNENLPVCLIDGLPFSKYAVLLANTACLVGNSSSGIREGAFLGVPVVNIGQRQCTRSRSDNVLDVINSSEAIAKGINYQIAHGPYPSSNIYGDGRSGIKISEILENPLPPLDKKITY